MADVTKKSKKDKKAAAAVEAVVEPVAAVVDGEESDKEKKKRKKEKKRLEAEAAAQLATEVEGAEAKTGSDESAKKKRKKDSDASSNASSEVATAAAAAAEEASETEEQRRARKAAKKEKKRREAEAAAAAATDAADEVTEEKVEAKEEKRVKKSGGAASMTGSSSKPFRRNFYREDRAVSAMTEDEVAALRQELEVTIHAPNGVDVGFGAGHRQSEEGEEKKAAPRDTSDFVDIRPIRTFAQSGLPADMLECTSTFARPTAIQSQVWPAILSGRDVIAIAETGSGKTLGFMLPALIHILDQPALGSGPKAGPICLVLSPTRELAMQTQVVCETSGTPVGIRSTCIYGGVDKYAQKKVLKQGVHVVVATPGRLLGLIEEGALSLNRVTYLVLDEADRMLDLGFEPDIRAIVGKVGPERQTLLFSATWPASIQALGREFVQNPFHVTIGKAGTELAANHRVKQIIEVIEDRARDRRILQLLNEYHKTRKNRILIFVLYKKEVDRVERWLSQNGWKAGGISGDKNQADRTAALQAFKDGSVPLLIATDVAARGLDIPSVEYVLNYSFPLTIEDYVHRIGRTGRGGKTGISHTFFTANEKGLAGELASVLKEAGEPVPEELLKFGLTTKKKEHALYGNHFRKDSEMKAMAPQRKVKFD